ncbi:hypothetical protein GGR52DRAFT_81378 [Hypoxylon sp. FL1284]|nr:hypothetical protein GGR52DRAFT_81378 [Hypoxylon sp. FL1284]
MVKQAKRWGTYLIWHFTLPNLSLAVRCIRHGEATGRHPGISGESPFPLLDFVCVHINLISYCKGEEELMI